jgi:prepilin-type N-terminal cleavage/methylation domain-containing protein
MESSSRVQFAFTLTELLAVMAALAMLAVSALSNSPLGTKAGAQQVGCLNNKRQMDLAWIMYAGDNSTKLATTFEWVGGAVDYAPNNTDNTNINLLMKGQLAPYLKGPQAYKCPADESNAHEGAAVLPRCRSISMSQAICLPNNTDWVHLPWLTYSKSSQITNPTPANLFVFIDENPDSINDGEFAIDPTHSGAAAAFVDGPSLLHHNGCILGFADGHAEAHQWTDPRTLGPRFQTHYDGAYLGLLYIMANNLDVAWLEFRTSANITGRPAW